MKRMTVPCKGVTAKQRTHENADKESQQGSKQAP